jgi:putative phage-type endonuclease
VTPAPQIVPGPGQQRSEGGIGASEVAAAIGLCPYQQPIDAWLRHTKRAEPFAGNEATFFGHVFEPVIRALYVEKNNTAVYVPPESIWHPSIDYLKATPDGIVIDAEGRWLYVGPQVKNVGWRQAERWDDGAIPEEYIVQGVTEMAVTSLDRIDFAVVIAGQHYEQPTLLRDPDLEADILTQLDEFWKLVREDRQPEVDGSDSFRRHLLKKITKRAVIVASEHDMPRIERWQEIVRAMKALKTEESEIKNRILAELVHREGNVLKTPLGNITVGKPGRKTAWKSVAETLSPMPHALAGVERELAALRAEAVEGPDLNALVQRIDALRAQVKLAASSFDNYPAICERFTATSDAPINRPKSWTASDDNNEEN